MENNLNVNTSRKVRDAKARIEFEDDPHRAAVEDNPEIAHVSASTWLAVLVCSDISSHYERSLNSILEFVPRMRPCHWPCFRNDGIGS